MSIRRVLVYRYGSVLRIGGERRTFHVAFTSSSSTAKIALVAPILGQLQTQFSQPVRRTGPFVSSCFICLCLALSFGSDLICLLWPSILTRKARGSGQSGTDRQRQRARQVSVARKIGRTPKLAAQQRREAIKCRDKSEPTLSLKLMRPILVTGNYWLIWFLGRLYL